MAAVGALRTVSREGKSFRHIAALLFARQTIKLIWIFVGIVPQEITRELRLQVLTFQGKFEKKEEFSRNFGKETKRDKNPQAGI